MKAFVVLFTLVAVAAAAPQFGFGGGGFGGSGLLNWSQKALMKQ